MTPTEKTLDIAALVKARVLVASYREELAELQVSGTPIAQASFLFLDYIEYLESKLAAPQTNGDHFDGSHG